MTEIKKYDVVIIGGGVAGSTAALFLKKYGVSNICILDKEEFPRIKPCTGLVTEAAHNLLLEIDIDVLKDLKYIKSYDRGTKIFNNNKFQMDIIIWIAI